MIKSNYMLEYLLADDVFIKNHANYEDKIVHFLKDMKMMCIQYAVCYKIMNDIEEVDDISLVKKLVYSPESDTYYIYVENENYAKYVLERIIWGSWMSNGFMKSSNILYVDENIYQIELVFNEQLIIERNKAYNLKTISI